MSDQGDRAGAKSTFCGRGGVEMEDQKEAEDKIYISKSWSAVLGSPLFVAAIGFRKDPRRMGHFIGGKTASLHRCSAFPFIPNARRFSFSVQSSRRTRRVQLYG